MTGKTTRTGNNGPSHRLTFQDVIDVWNRHWSGDFLNRLEIAPMSANPNETGRGCLQQRTDPQHNATDTGEAHVVQ